MFIAACMLIASSYAQSNTNAFMESEPKTSTSSPPPTVYLGMSTGLNNMIGIFGPQLDVVLSDKFTGGTGIGISSWGLKWALNLKYYPKGYYQFYIKGGYSYNTGLKDFEVEMELISGKKQDVTMDLKPVGNIFLREAMLGKLANTTNFLLKQATQFL